jgi:glycosyltransferase involved in cell wall biosynthesis
VPVKLALIVQRYGREIPGGAETLARQIAERLARRNEIDVLTTTARDYVTWRNEYPPSEEKLRGVKVKRFPVETERNLEEFNRYSDWIYANPHSREDELRWLDMQGPVVPKLIEHLKKEHGRYDLLVFFTYLYYPTYYGMQVAPDKSVLLPTAHDEPPLKLDIYKEVFEQASSFVFNTEAEELLVLQRFPVQKKMRETIGMGMELLDPPDTTAFRRRHKASSRFLLYAGRIDEGKGCGELLSFFSLFREEHPDITNLQLVLIGKQNMRLPSSKDIRYLGFLNEDDKLAAMASATAVVIPSRLESLSIVALEAFSVGTPVVVNAGSRVLVEHCRKANAGLYYSSYEEFEGIIEALLADKSLVRGLGRQGQRYVKDNFGWEKLLPLYEVAFRSSSRAPRPASAPERKPPPRRMPKQVPKRVERPKATEPPSQEGRDMGDGRVAEALPEARTQDGSSPQEVESKEVASQDSASVDDVESGQEVPSRREDAGPEGVASQDSAGIDDVESGQEVPRRQEDAGPEEVASEDSARPQEVESSQEAADRWEDAGSEEPASREDNANTEEVERRGGDASPETTSGREEDGSSEEKDGPP